jgi:hypothetical protein
MKSIIIFSCGLCLTLSLLVSVSTSNAGWLEKTYKGEIYCNTLKGIEWQNCNWLSNNFVPLGLNLRQALCINYSWYYKKWVGIANYGEAAGTPYTSTARIKCYTLKL